MELVLVRDKSNLDATIGKLSVDGKFFCYTCEDVVRTGPKVPGETAIPAGKYQVVITMSPRFKRDLPLLLNVPGFEGIRIHPGNTSKDTEGCILPGMERTANTVLRSREAFNQLFTLIEASLKAKKPVSITIT